MGKLKLYWVNMTLPSSSPAVANYSVLVTGATGAIGRAIVQQLSLQGLTVFAGGRDKTALDALVKNTQGVVMPLNYDVTDEQAVKAIFRVIQQEQAKETVGKFVGLVNNAGVMKASPLVITSKSDLQQQFNVNFFAAYQHMQLASRLMARHKQGVIVNLLSQIGEQGSQGLSAYSASKAALTGATKSLAKELAPLGIRVNGVAPGFIETPLTDHFSDQERNEIKNRIALKKLGTAEQVAQAVAFLIDERSSYTTGHILPVDGLFQV